MSGSTNTIVRNLAIECGFEGVGFARAEPVESETATRVRDWIEGGRHASMRYMEENLEKRLDPRLVLRSARTVIALAANYYRDNPTLKQETGKIARYAGGRDYHKVIGKRLRRFRTRLLDQFPDAEFWYSLDTDPVLERYWAQKAGLGWVGKNTNLLTEKYGSWVFLATLLTSLELAPCAPHPDHCGTCELCLEACPTGAFIEPGRLDSAKCLSYWTIEHRGELDPRIVENLNGWFFGCDDCQEICPWNRHASPTPETEFELDPVLACPNLVVWAKIERERWDTLTRGTALRRAGYEGFRRNAKNLLGKDTRDCDYT